MIRMYPNANPDSDFDRNFDEEQANTTKLKMMDILHITSGDCAGGSLAKAGLPGEVFVWHDILYDGPRNPG